jgi:drug/metabolite transporter (DMT)-like permease
VGARLTIAAAAVLWSFGGLFVKVLQGVFGVQPQAIACLRSAAAGIALAWALPRIAGAPLVKVGGASVAYLGTVLLFVQSTSMTSAANAIFLQYFYPLLTAVGAALLFSERIDRRTVAALVLGTAGVGIIVGGSWNAADQEGVALGLMSAVTFAAFVLIQRAIRAGGPIGLVAAYNLATALLLLPFAWPHLRIPTEAYVLLAVMGIFQLGIPYALFVKGLKTVPAAEAAIITLLEPVLNPIWVWLGRGEVPNVWTVMGGTLLLLALAVRFLAVRRA